MLAVAALLLLLAEQPPPQTAFKSGVNLVEVDIVVTDKGGKPVRGLRQEDFAVFEDGKPVDVATFVAIDLPLAQADATIAPADRSGTSIRANDQPEDGRLMLIVLDDYHVRFDAGYAVRTRAVARKLVERLGPSDQVAVIATSGRSGMQAEFTDDKARLIAAIDTFFPQSEQSVSEGIVQDSLQRSLSAPSGGNFGFVGEIKSRWATDTLSNAARALAQIPHRRKAMLFVSEGLPVSVDQIISNQYAAGAWAGMRDFILTAQRSNVAVYPVDPCGVSTECSTAAQQNLRTLAESTGGFAVLNTNAPQDSVERIVAENGTYYLLGYSSPAASNDGRRHRITVRTRVPDVEVRARDGYVSSRRASKDAPRPAPLDALVGAPIQSRGLTMRVAAVPAPLGSSPWATVVIGIELTAKAAVEANEIAFTVVAIDAAGKVHARQRFSNTFAATGAPPAGWARLRSHIPVEPGRYLIRVAAVAANGMHGSVFTEADVPKFTGDLELGGLSIVAPGTSPLVNANHRSPVLELTPLATRDVPDHTPTAAHLPIRVAQKAASVSLTITATLVKPDGGTVETDHAPRATSDYQKPSGGVCRIAIPPDLAAGSYRLVVNATLGRTRVTREMAFRVVAGLENER
jgi:VWFA-related protein